MGRKGNKEQETLELVGLIYEASMDNHAWPRMLESLAAYMDTQTALFRVSDAVTDEVSMGFAHGLDESYMKQYREHYIHEDPYRPALKTFQPGRFNPGQSAVPYEELTRYEFYNDFVLPSGIHYTLGGFAMRDRSLGYQMTVQRGKQAGDFTEEEIERFNSLIPHLQRAFKINQRMATLAHQRLVAETALDRLGTGVIFCDEDGRAVHMNRKAEEILAGRQGLCMVSGKPAARGLQDNGRLQQLIHNAAGKGKGDARTGGAMSLSHEFGQGRPLAILVTPLCPGNLERMSFLNQQACIALFVGSPANADTPDAEIVRTLYGLTEAEARLATALARGKSLEEICAFYRISYHTGRSQLKSIFSKTETSRQAEVVNLILTSPAAL